MANEVELEKVSREVFGISSRRYRQIAKEGLAPQVSSGRIDFIEAARALIEYYRKLAEGSGSMSLVEERTRLTKIQADRKEIELLKAMGELLPVREAMNAWSAVVLRMKARLQGSPRKLAPILFGCTRETEIQELLQREIDEICSELAEPDLKEISAQAGNAGARSERGVKPPPAKAKTKRKPVGGPEQDAQPRGKRRAREVVHGKG